MTKMTINIVLIKASNKVRLYDSGLKNNPKGYKQMNDKNFKAAVMSLEEEVENNFTPPPYLDDLRAALVVVIDKFRSVIKGRLTLKARLCAVSDFEGHPEVSELFISRSVRQQHIDYLLSGSRFKITCDEDLYLTITFT
jgi:hypothetical protein